MKARSEVPPAGCSRRDVDDPQEMMLPQATRGVSHKSQAIMGSGRTLCCQKPCGQKKNEQEHGAASEARCICASRITNSGPNQLVRLNVKEEQPVLEMKVTIPRQHGWGGCKHMFSGFGTESKENDGATCNAPVPDKALEAGG